ncbi:MAG: ABC transporter ATP-binding protein [Acidimicrobiia bacterium]|nr:ABC transporter ATP-binding protein [Acidimicrobiia bacterium]
MTPLLQMTGVTKRFPGVMANRDVTFSVDAGEIHGLLGENGAGKSTLMKILYGLVEPNEGRIEIDGNEARIRSPRHALELGVGMVHQHFMLVPTMTVAENVALGLRSDRPPLSRLRVVARRVADLSERYGLHIDPDQRIADLSVGLQQRVEILKLLYRGARLLVLDEPTAVLTPQEWHELEQTMRSLAEAGKGIVFISHKLDEQLAVADRCTVLRDGAVMGSVATADVDKATLARMMVGREVVLRAVRLPRPAGRPVLEVADLGLETPDGRRLLADLTFSIAQGEIVGVAGVDGNGQRELVEVLTGVRPATSGTIRHDGEVVTGLTARRYHRIGAVIPEDRHRMAIALGLTVSENLMLKEFGKAPFSRRGVTRPRASRDFCRTLVDEFDIRTPSLDVTLRQLSGGNQQKVVVAREMYRSPDLLIAAQPTRGLDVGAMEFVYRRMLEHRERGGATLLVSTELDEILSLSDRIAVLVDGRFVALIDDHAVDVEELGLLMGGSTDKGAG